MEAQYVLPHDVQRRRPIFVEVGPLPDRLGVPQRAYVIRECVDPHVHDVTFVARYLHPPIESRPADAEIPQSPLDEGYHLVAARIRRDEIGMALVMLQQSIGVIRQTEEVRILLLHPRYLRARGGLPVHEFGLVVVALVPHRVPPLVATEIHGPIVIERLPQVPDGTLVMILRRPYESIVAHVHQPQQVAEGLGHGVAELHRFHPRVPRRRLHLLPVFVGAAQEAHVPSGVTHVPRDDVAREAGVRVADVGFVVHVVYRGGDTEGGRAVVGGGGGGARRR